MATTGRNQRPLCPNCKCLNIDEVFSSYRSPISWSYWWVCTFDAGCPLCELFLHLYSAFRLSRTECFKISLYSLPANGRHDQKATVEEFDQDGISRLAVLPKINSTGYLRHNSPIQLPPTETGCIFQVWRQAITNGMTQLGQTDLQNPKIDFTQLRAWLTECCHYHRTSCAKPIEPEALPGMRVINVRTRDLVSATLDFDYAALSYVWGSRNKNTAGNYLPNPAPKTIEDALEVTKRLGIPYLWVDRYCIRQDRPDEKHDQISKMHLIYHNARVTIIAVAGTQPEHGIPGIRGTPRAAQPYVDLGHGLLVATFPHPTTVIKKSKWASRGWTYQEAALSRRRLAFTAYGAYFECNHTFRSEGVEEPIRQMVSKSPRGLTLRLCGGISAWSSHNIWQHISEFSKRDVSYQEDRMNALLGVFGAMEKSGMLKGHLWGIPIQAYSSSVFLTNLMWDTRGPTRRNFQFPSWSWTGWIGEISLSFEAETANKRQKTAYTDQLWVELSNGTLISIEDYQELSGKVMEVYLPSKYIHVRAYTFRCRFKVKGLHDDYGEYGYHGISIILAGGQEFIIESGLRTHWKIEGTNLEARLASDIWDVIFWPTSPDLTYYLVLYRFSNHAERFGYFWDYGNTLTKIKLIAEDRTFRLG